jgi:hydrogenase-4 component B
MQYNSTSYSEPLARVFGGSLHTRRSIEVVSAENTPLLVEGIAFSQETTDLVEDRVYLPAIRALTRVGDLARKLQNGSLHRYLGFSFAALILVLVVVTR